MNDVEYKKGVIASMRARAANLLEGASSLQREIDEGAEYVEVPVTERRRITLLGTFGFRIIGEITNGDQIVLRPAGGQLRPGIFTAREGWTLGDVHHAIAAASIGDEVYRVEPA